MNYQRRAEELRKRMNKVGVEAVFVANDAAREYFTGINRTAVLLTRERHNSAEFGSVLITMDKVIVFAPSLQTMGFKDRMDEFPIVDELVAFPEPDMVGRTFDEKVTALGLDNKRLGVNRDVSSRLTLRLQDKHNAKIVDVSDEIDEMRMIKDADEIEMMRKAAAIADAAYYDMLPLLKPGALVRDLQCELERLLQVHGSSYSSFPAEILNHGPLAGPSHGAGYEKLAPDHVMAYDYGAMYKGYASDFGRTIFLQDPTDEMVKCHEIVMAAQKAALDSYKPGVTKCSDLTKVCHGYIEDAGYGDYFFHRMGHCIGKDVHERPFMAEGEETLMQPGLTFTDEPSIYIPQKFCIRVEDVFLCTENGFECFNKVTKDIVVLK